MRHGNSADRILANIDRHLRMAERHLHNSAYGRFEKRQIDLEKQLAAAEQKGREFAFTPVDKYIAGLEKQAAAAEQKGREFAFTPADKYIADLEKQVAAAERQRRKFAFAPVDKYIADLEKQFGRARAGNLEARGIEFWQKQTVLALSFKENEIDRLKEATLLTQGFYQDNFWKSVDGLRDSFVGELTSSMREAIVDSVNDQELVNKIEALIEKKITEMPESKLSREFLWHTVFAILGLILTAYTVGLSTYQFIDSKKSSEEQKATGEKIVELLQKIAENTSSKSEDRSFDYIVDRVVPVKQGPRFKAATICLLPKNTKVKLLQSKHKWLLVEYIDYFELKPKTGWVNKKYLNF